MSDTEPPPQPITLLDDIDEFLRLAHDHLPAFEQNQARRLRERIAAFFDGDYYDDELGTAY